MRILITNDDGIDAPGIEYLAVWAKKLGTPVVAAPKTEQSACSNSIIFTRPFEVLPSEKFRKLGIEAYSVDTTPADCVRFAAKHFGKFDLVLSGINDGLNIGYDIAYSGTCAAAFQANYEGIKSVAISAYSRTVEKSKDHLDAILDFFTERSLMEYSDTYCVNIPENVRGIKIVKQGRDYYNDHFLPCGENLYRASLYISHDPSVYPDDLYDTLVIPEGYISVVPLTINRTNNDAISKLL